MARNYKTLKVFKEADNFARLIYRATNKFSRDLGYLSSDNSSNLTLQNQTVLKMLRALINKHTHEIPNT